MKVTARAVRATIVGPPRRVWRRWSRSMMLRLVVTTLVVGLSAVALLGAYLTSQIRDGLVDTRVERILAESARDSAAAQAQMNAATAETPGELQLLVYDTIDALQVLGGDDRGLVLLPDPDNSSNLVLNTLTSSSPTVVSPEMRAAVEAGSAQPWQFVEIPGTEVPGVVVGSSLEIRSAGEYELYFVYSLENEQETLSLIQQVLAFGAGALVALVVFMAFMVTLQAVRPVRAAARVASRLADGRLSERMPVRGNDEMATLARTFNEMAESLQRQITRMEGLSRLQRRFVSDVSHELRTPLTTVRMASDILYDARDTFPPDVSRSAELLNNQLDRFETLLADLLEISRIDAGAARLEFDRIDLGDVVREEIEAILPAIKDHGVRIRLWMSPGTHMASMDRPRVSRIVRNLLSNAVEHAERKPIDVAVVAGKRGVGLVVRDYGVGLTPQQAERVFDRFWRADAARARTMGGTGLGLSIAREDATLHDGKLEAWGSPGNGASFRLMLPRTSRGLGQQPVMPLVLREAEFGTVGERVPLSTDSSEGVKP
ncbi:MtrAB system histidine kinase MtrB [Demequina aurantiaca]|uniref:MtrAB system histidine kinase MtrB n=1 Tax=Demequina aurantiaca TaxID=676200 RepID=UPI0009FF7FD4|nr:MtrAB system histidine kinase MtrB [Demequina aurantiaca]